MVNLNPSKAQLERIDKIVAHYRQEESQSLLSIFKEQLLVALRESQSLTPFVHSIKSRIKEPEHLRQKLLRKLRESKQQRSRFHITPENLFVEIGDLAGIRILHLYTRQFSKINDALQEIFSNYKYRVIEGPFARTWDVEYRGYFQNLGVEVQESETLYTSVHYLIESASSTRMTCEIQVRTLMEEVWGEVDHSINYPTPITNIACGEQIKVLARVTSSATRLVDSIFATVDDLDRHKLRRSARLASRRPKLRDVRTKR